MQVALIVIMAQIGSFVPAKFASVRLVDKLFTRIGTSDSIESNSSSFMVEMQETAHIVNHATERRISIETTLSCILYSSTSCPSLGSAQSMLHALTAL
jgi:DNA mismatch repair protein MSH4